MASTTSQLTSPDPVVEVRGLRVETDAGDAIVEDLSLSLGSGETLGVVGESGSGKTTAVLALLGHAQAGARIAKGEISVAGESLAVGDEKSARKLRGRLVSYVPQNPGTALNPSLRIGDAIAEMIRSEANGSQSTEAIGERLSGVGLPGDSEFQRRYPHQLSGGQQQRVCIAIALVCGPPVVVLDEPTTGLDVITQATILSELQRVRSEQGVAMVYVSHDLAVVAGIADRIAVFYAGRIVEEGPTEQIICHPRHPYTRGLLLSLPDHLKPRVLTAMPGVSVGVGGRPRGCSFAARCPVKISRCEEAMPDLLPVGEGHSARCIRAAEVKDPEAAPLPERPLRDTTHPLLAVKSLVAEHRGRSGSVIAAQDISFELARGECVGLVGESGSGKTTIARAIAGLHPISGGTILLDGEPLPSLAAKRSPAQRQRVQMIFQNPADALNPRHTVQTTIARPAQLLRKLGSAEALKEVDGLLDLVRLPKRTAHRYPTELSGGERQRVGIARALAAHPDVIICDEITSALDVSVQAAVLKLLGELRSDLGLSLLFITHDLGVVATIADRTLVLDRGLICEAGSTATVLDKAVNGYTQRLLEAAPSISHAMAGWA
jgi:peptide/nickel transport system ATP-binding protein